MFKPQFKKITSFITDETGAVTVDWVILTAAIITLSLVVLIVIGTSTEDISANMSTALTDIEL